MRAHGAARTVRAGLLVLGLVAAAPGAGAQPPAAPPAPSPTPAAEPTPPPPRPIEIPEVAAAAEKAERTLRGIEESLAPDPRITAIADGLAEQRPQIEARVAEARRLLEAGMSLRTLREVEARGIAMLKELDGWRDELSSRAAGAERERARLTEMREVWAATLEHARAGEAPPAVIEQIQRMQSRLKAVRKDASERSKVLLTLQADVVGVGQELASFLEEVRKRRSEQEKRILVAERPPIWEAVPGRADLSGLLGGVGRQIRIEANLLATFASEFSSYLVLHALAFAAAAAAALSLRLRMRRRRAEGRSVGPGEAIFETPVSMAVLVVFPLLFVLYPVMPRPLLRAIGLLLWIPVLRVLRALLPPALHRGIVGLAGFYLLDRVRDLFDPAPALERLLFLLEMGVAFVLAMWLLRPERLRELAPGERLPRAFARVLQVAAAGFGLAFVVNGFGLVNLSRLLGEGLLGAAYSAALLFAVARVLQLVVGAGLSTPALRRLRIVSLYGSTFRARVGRLIGLLAGAAWLYVVASQLGLDEPLLESLQGVLGREFGLGSLGLRLGDLLAGAITLLVAFWVARGVRIVLEDEVLPRASLARGVPHAISVLAQYSVLLIGFLLAAAAGGFDWGRITLLAGAFSVGIGFGLQNVVNNFVSGLILLFERPVQVGDTVEVGSLVGEVRRIGIRSSTVRTWQGAEVIVPNSNLISEQVVNWTLSDRYRRVEIPVGVAYGSDPERVLGLLRAAAEGVADVLTEPAPLALFTGFGESSLDFELRLWTGSPDRVALVRSEVAIAIHAALRDAGIAIPFPQRDLHLVSTPRPAAAAEERPGLAREPEPQRPPAEVSSA